VHVAFFLVSPCLAIDSSSPLVVAAAPDSEAVEPAMEFTLKSELDALELDDAPKLDNTPELDDMPESEELLAPDSLPSASDMMEYCACCHLLTINTTRQLIIIGFHFSIHPFNQSCQLKCSCILGQILNAKRSYILEWMEYILLLLSHLHVGFTLINDMCGK
jgi:hypothetical protein